MAGSATGERATAGRVAALAGLRPPDWRPLLALVLISLMDVALSDGLTIYGVLPEGYAESAGASQFLLNLVFLLPALVFWLRRSRRWLRRVTVAYTAWATIGLFISIATLVGTLELRKAGGTRGDSPFYLLWDGVLVWGVAVLVFAVWYWLIDAGGPEARQAETAERPDFLFTQQQTPIPGWEGWRPDFVDHVFAAFGTGMAFSATDTLPLSRRAKLLMMAQATACIVVVLTVVARAVNMIA